MPAEAQISHRNVRAANIPYVSLLSPTETTPCYVPGSQDILTSIAGYAERRPGFSDSDATGFTNLQRVFTWDRNDGTFYKMYCDINGSSQAVVYKWAMLIDVAPVSIYTDTGSSTPFDFVVSNNTLYFSNGNVAKKWDPVNGVSNWGIAIGSVNNATGPTVAGVGANSGTGIAWTNPNNVTSAVNYATASIAIGSNSQFDNATQFGFAIPANSTIVGLQVTVENFANPNNNLSKLSLTMVKAGSQTGSTKAQFFVNASVGTLTYGGTNDLWGSNWTPNDINQTTFGVALQGIGGGAAITANIRNVRITVYSLGGPIIAVAAGAGSMSATVGYQYVFCYGNSNTGHVSSPTPASASTGVFASKLNVQVSLTASTDSQVNQIRVFRSTDSVAVGTIGATFFEIPTSPYANTTANITDNAADNALIPYSVAPIPGFNDPPTPGRGPVYFAGRIWLYTGNKANFSSLEENTIGVPEESFVSGVAGNFWNFDQPTQGLAVAGSANAQTLLIYCGGRLYGIVGSSLDTFRKFTIATRRGCRNLAAIATLGSMVAWFDSSGQIWGTDGTSMEELGTHIRPDLVGVNQANVSMTFHAAGKAHWLLVSTGTKVFTYDLDTEQWMPPWTFAAQYLYSGETSPGNYLLFGAQATRSLTMSTTLHNDNGASYQPIGKTNLMSLVPDFGTRFSSVAMGLYDEPTRTGIPWGFEVDTNNVGLSDVLFVADDDPTDASTTYTSVFANVKTPQIVFRRGQGAKLVQNIYPVTQPTARWMGWQWKGLSADDALRVYGFFMWYTQKP